MLQIVLSIRDLSRQVLAIRRDGGELNSNLKQLHCMVAEEDPNLA